MRKPLFALLLPTLATSVMFASSAQAEMERLGETELSTVSGQSGISLDLAHLRVNAYAPGSVDNPDTPVDESDGRQKNGFKLDYVTKNHAGGGETHYFIDDVSLAMDLTGAITLDIEEDGALLIGLPDAVNFVGDGLALRNIHLNQTGLATDGGKMMNEINMQGNFDTGGTIRMWSE